MAHPVEFRDVSWNDALNGLSFEAQAGRSLLIITGREDESVLLIRLITGLTLPTSGSVLIAGAPTTGMPDSRLRSSRQSIGVVPPNGGLVSNLKLWENIILPELYHIGTIPAATEDEAEKLLRQFGYNGNVMALPARLSLFEKRMAAFIRGALRNPAVMIYSHHLDGLPQYSCDVFTRAIKDFHASRPDTAAIFLSKSRTFPSGMEFDAIIDVHQPSGGEVPRT